MPSAAPAPTILVVDDDEGLLILVATALRREKWNVATASSGAGGLAWRREHSADLLLLDLKLHDIEGRDFIGALADVWAAPSLSSSSPVRATRAWPWT